MDESLIDIRMCEWLQRHVPQTTTATLEHASQMHVSVQAVLMVPTV